MGDMGLTNGFAPEQIHLARVLAERYESKGWKCFPSKSNKKAPLLPSYAQYWENPAPPVSELWDRWPSGNVQVVTGRNEGLCAIDCDGEEGIEQFRRWCDERGTTVRTWVVSNDGREGRHLWFLIPKALRSRPTPKRLLWGVWEPKANDGSGGWKKRAAIEFIGDRSLIMAPPSINPRNGLMYQFHKGCDPMSMPHPAYLPAWLLGMPTMQPGVGSNPPKRGNNVPNRSGYRHVPGSLDLPCRPSDVVDAIGDKLSLARSWRLQVASDRVNPSGWLQCHDHLREDSHPSAMFNPSSGRFWRPPVFGDERSICFFRLGVELGIYQGWREACVDLARTYLSHLFSGSVRNAG